jgi:hypothetical protein
VILLCRRAATKQLIDDFRGALNDLKQAKNIAHDDDDTMDVEAIAKDIDDLKAKLDSPNK